MDFNIDKHVDCVGLFCPMPLLKTKKSLKDAKIGQVLEVIATDNNVVRDLATWSKQSGQKILLFEEKDDGIKRFLIKKLC